MCCPTVRNTGARDVISKEKLRVMVRRRNTPTFKDYRRLRYQLFFGWKKVVEKLGEKGELSEIEVKWQKWLQPFPFSIFR